MKTNLKKLLITTVCLLCSIGVSAYDFEVDGLQYNVVSLDALYCVLAGSNNGFEGDVVIPEQVNYATRTLTVVGLEDRLFRGCSKMTGITIPSTISSISDYAFEGCSGLTSVTIPNSMTSISEGAFKGCSGITNVVIEDGETVLNFGSERYDNWNYYGLFYDCPIKSLYIGRELTYKDGEYYGYSPFAMNENITDVTIGNYVTEIGYYAFYGCSGLVSVTIGKSVRDIRNYAFYGCTSLTLLYSLNTTVPYISDHNFANKQYVTTTVFVPQDALEAYQNAEDSKNFWNLQGFDPTGIKDGIKDGVSGSDRCYDLRGNRLYAPKRGINIINVEKVIVR